MGEGMNRQGKEKWEAGEYEREDGEEEGEGGEEEEDIPKNSFKKQLPRDQSPHN